LRIASARRRTKELFAGPGSTVVDIGTGPGIMAVLACQFGASRVYAIEAEPIIQVAREVAFANHCADKIEFYEDFSTSLRLPIRADVIVSDLRGVLPLFEYHIPSVVDARRRFLSPGGALISRRDTLWAAIAELPQAYAKLVGTWEQNILCQDLGPARRRIVNTVNRERAKSEQLLTKPQVWATLDYTTVKQADVQGTLSWVIDREGTGHGILVWFDADLADGVALSNAPGAPETIYGSLFFPWTQPVPLTAGQRLRVNLRAKLLEKDYTWLWMTDIEPADGSRGVTIHFDQSQLQGAVLSTAALHKQASGYVPQLSEEGCLHRRTLELMDGNSSLQAIAFRLAGEFPRRFRRREQALSYAGGVSREYSQ
jgi:Ribosomal protein L11 methyltransferase (PrmA)/Arginine methyltransferase oligomerization subdomain